MARLARAIVLCCLLACLMRPATAATDMQPALADRIDETSEEWLSSTGAPSVSIAIVQHGEVVYAKTHGRTGGTRYAIDSLSKGFTATALLWLAAHGRLSLEDPLRRWFPDLGPAAAVTLRQLLTQTSGIRDYWPQDFVTPEMSHAIAPAAIAAAWARRPLDFKPGSEWQYSNTNYVLAGLVVERAAGTTLFDFLQRYVFTPLGMTDVVDESMPPSSQDAVGTTRFGLGPDRPAAREGPGWLFGAAGLRMSARDVAQWDISVIYRSLLDARSYQAQLRPVMLEGGREAPYGMGLDVVPMGGRPTLGHSGSGSGFLADNRIWPAERTAIVILTNDDWAPPSTLSARIAQLILPPMPAEARARQVFEQLQNGNLDRSLFDATGNFYFSAAALADLHDSLGSLGPAHTVELERESKRGGMLTRVWKILCKGARLEVVERGYPGGKLEEFLVLRRDD